MPEHDEDYTTTHLGVATFLQASGYERLDAYIDGPSVTFVFPAAASNDARKYFRGQALPVRDVIVADRVLRGVIRKLRGKTKKRAFKQTTNSRRSHGAVDSHVTPPPAYPGTEQFLNDWLPEC